MTEDRPKPKESMMEFLRRTRRFSDLVLLGWGTIEFDMEQLMMSEFGLKWGDKRGKILFELPFNKKLEFLRENKVFSRSEYEKLKHFQEYRNKLFHGKYTPFIHTESEKDKIMDDVVDATNIAHRALFRKKSS